MTLPEAFTEQTRALMGSEVYERLCAALALEPPVSIRTNAAKLRGRVAGGEPVPWCDGGFYLEGRPAFTFDPLLHAGWYYVQEASSMFLARVLRQHVHGAALVLDLCAAPGGKSTCALGSLPPESALFCNEPVRQRAAVLAENIQKWGRPEVIVTNNLPEDYARSGLMFDVILCDVPCSGEGMFRKDEEAIAQWSAEGVARCAALQRQIVSSAWQCLRPGGLLVYSTCTFNASEDEDNVAWACRELGAELLPVSCDEAWGISGSLSPALPGPAYRFIPGLTRGEGLFMAAMRKGGSGEPCLPMERRKGRRQTGQKPSSQAAEWLIHPEEYIAFASCGSIIAVPKRLAPSYEEAVGKLRVMHAGITIGTPKGRDIVPSQSLALSTELRREAFPCVELSYQEAIAYLRREQLALPCGTPRGFVLVSYQGAPLGFVKNIGTRANNLYPQEWRIKSTHTPNEGEQPAVIATD